MHLRPFCFAAVSAGCLILPTRAAYSQQLPDVFESWAHARIIPLRGDEADTTVTNFLPLRDLVGRASVVALGEATHGSHEPLAFRNRLFRFLVERMGFTAIAIESGLTESEAVNRYINGGPGDLSEIVRNGISWGFGDFGENKDLIAWMRSYNANPAHTKKLRFYGIDLSGSGNGAFPYARRAVDAALTSLRGRDVSLAESLATALNPILAHFSSDSYDSLSPAERRQLAGALAKLHRALEAEREGARGPDDDQTSYAWSLQNVRVADQLRRMLEVYPSVGPSPGIPPEAYRAETVRNWAMAQNVQWAMQLEGSGGRLLVFAHNNHVMNSTITGGPWSAFRVAPPAMGKFLRSQLRNRIVIIGSAYETTTLANYIDSSSFDLALSRVARSPFVLDLRPAHRQPSVVSWLRQRLPLHVNGSDYVVVKPISAFDAIVFVGALTSAHSVGSSASLINSRRDLSLPHRNGVKQ